jgi:hypothetical protein
MEIADQPLCGRLRTAETKRKKQKVDEQCTSLRSDAQKTCRALREKRPKKKTVILQHDKVRPHTHA